MVPGLVLEKEAEPQQAQKGRTFPLRTSQPSSTECLLSPCPTLCCKNAIAYCLMLLIYSCLLHYKVLVFHAVLRAGDAACNYLKEIKQSDASYIPGVGNIWICRYCWTSLISPASLVNGQGCLKLQLSNIWRAASSTPLLYTNSKCISQALILL